MEPTQYNGWDAWAKKFKPIQNKFYPNEPETKMFETYGEEVEFVNNYDHRYVWTNLTGEMSDLVCAGYHYVNRIGYYITEVPWDNEDDYALLSIEEECHCYNEDGYEDGEMGKADCPDCEGYGLKTRYLDEDE